MNKWKVSTKIWEKALLSSINEVIDLKKGPGFPEVTKFLSYIPTKLRRIDGGLKITKFVAKFEVDFGAKYQNFKCNRIQRI